MRPIKTDELIAADLHPKVALLAGVIAEVHTLIEKAKARAASHPDGTISDPVAEAILDLTTPVIEAFK
jgi:hypothetical protein